MQMPPVASRAEPAWMLAVPVPCESRESEAKSSPEE